SGARRGSDFADRGAVGGRFRTGGGRRPPRNRATGFPPAGGCREVGGRESVVRVLGAARGGGNGFGVWSAGVGVGDPGALQRDDLCRQPTRARNWYSDGARRNPA